MLDNNEFCKRCVKCCLNTEMVLTRSDIERLTRLGYKGFYRFFSGFYKLVNINGHCVFLDPHSGRCMVYEHRPLGCRAYPLIYDEQHGIVIDEYCPFSRRVKCNELVKGVSEIINVLRELENDYEYIVDWKLVKRSIEIIMERCGGARDHQDIP